MITPKENLLNVLRHQEPEWIPWLPLIDPWANIPSFVPSELQTIESEYLKCAKIGQYFAKHFGADIIVRTGGLLERNFTSVKITETKNGSVTSTKYETDAGILTSKTEARPYGKSSLMTSRIAEYIFKGPQDFGSLKSLIRNTNCSLEEERFKKTVNQVGENGLVCTNVPSTPIMQLILGYMGVEKFIYTLSDYPAETEELMEIMSEKLLQCHNLIANSSAQAILLTSDANTLLLSPRLYEKYALPSLQKYTGILHKANKVILYHSCGYVKDLISLIGQTGIDAHEYLTPPPVGNTPFLEARRIWGDKITIMGAIDPLLMERGEKGEIKKYVAKLLKDMAPGKNFILETSSKVNVPRENIEAVAEVMNKFRKYPLTL